MFSLHLQSPHHSIPRRLLECVVLQTWRGKCVFSIFQINLPRPHLSFGSSIFFWGFLSLPSPSPPNFSMTLRADTVQISVLFQFSVTLEMLIKDFSSTAGQTRMMEVSCQWYRLPGGTALSLLQVLAEHLHKTEWAPFKCWLRRFPFKESFTLRQDLQHNFYGPAQSENVGHLLEKWLRQCTAPRTLQMQDQFLH